jgi:hypothetical protein
MVYTLSYQMYKSEHGLSPAEQRAADVRAGEAARATAGAVTRTGAASVRLLPSGR